MVPAMTFTPIQAQIANQQQLANGLTEEKPAASTNVDCNRTVCVEGASHTGGPVTAERFGLQGFIMKPGMQCPSKTFSVWFLTV
jgi:hypothetical protein